MQNSEEKPFGSERSSQGKSSTLNWYSILGRYRKHPETLESILSSLKSSGISEEKLPKLQETLVAWRKDYVEERSSRYQNIDRYVIGGMGAIDIILLPVALTTGIADKALSIALLALVVSLPLLGCSLYLSFYKQELRITSYGIVLPTLVTLAALISYTAITAFIWHVSPVDGKVFLSLTGFLILFINIYIIFIFFRRFYSSTVAELRKIVAATPDELEQKEKTSKGEQA